MSKKGLLLVVSGPSGAGKGTICEKLLKINNNVKISVSATTRKPRKGEIEGKSYYFMNKSRFESMIENDDFLEWAHFCDNYYGTPKENVNRLLDKGIDVILEIEVQGAMKVKNNVSDAIFIFIMPPSFDELKSRLTGRKTESEDVIQKRLEKAKYEINLVKNYDYVIVNDIAKEAAKRLDSIILSEKNKVKNNIEIAERVLNNDLSSIR